MKTLLLIAFMLVCLIAYALHTRQKYYKDYVRRKTDDQRYINNERKGWKW